MSQRRWGFHTGAGDPLGGRQPCPTIFTMVSCRRRTSPNPKRSLPRDRDRSSRQVVRRNTFTRGHPGRAIVNPCGRCRIITVEDHGSERVCPSSPGGATSTMLPTAVSLLMRDSFVCETDPDLFLLPPGVARVIGDTRCGSRADVRPVRQARPLVADGFLPRACRLSRHVFMDVVLRAPSTVLAESPRPERSQHDSAAPKSLAVGENPPDRGGQVGGPCANA